MKKLCLIGMLVLTGCATTPPPPGPGLLSPLVDSGTISADTRTKARQVQAYVVQACQFEPQLASLVQLVNVAVGMGVSAIGGAVCNAATSVPLADGGTRKIIVHGVRIKGKRVVTVLR